LRGGADASVCCSCPRCSPFLSSSLRKGGATRAASVNVVALRAPIGKHGADSKITVGALPPIPSQNAGSSRVHGARRPRRRTSTPCLTRGSWPRAGVRRPEALSPPPGTPGREPNSPDCTSSIATRARYPCYSYSDTHTATHHPACPRPSRHDPRPYRLGTEFSHSDRHLGPHRRLGHKRSENNVQSL
jgi:hypothetical protein